MAQQTHPTPENLAIASTYSVSRRDTMSGDAALDRLAELLRRLRVVVRIGGEAAEGGADFGQITDMAVDSQGRMLIMDRSDKSISRWTSHGRPAGRFGRNGGGPLEFQYPQGLAVAGDGSVIAADRAQGLKHYRWDSIPELLGTWIPGQTVDDICASGSSTVVQRLNEDGTVAQVLDRVGARTRGVGTVYHSENAFLSNVLSSQGHVACLPGGVIATSASILPFVRIWDMTGKPLITVKLSDLVPMRVTTSENDGVTYAMPPAGYDIIRRLVPVGREYLLVQVALQTLASSRAHAEWAELRSYLLRISDGRSVYVGTTLPLVGAAPLPKVFGWRNDPAPEAEILQ
jgi:hypothetical protein